MVFAQQVPNISRLHYVAHESFLLHKRGDTKNNVSMGDIRRHAKLTSARLAVSATFALVGSKWPRDLKTKGNRKARKYAIDYSERVQSKVFQSFFR